MAASRRMFELAGVCTWQHTTAVPHVLVDFEARLCDISTPVAGRASYVRHASKVEGGKWETIAGDSAGDRIL
eukprot:scaffold5706_cov124-Isochrysis_galbana.AAC.8